MTTLPPHDLSDRAAARNAPLIHRTGQPVTVVHVTAEYFPFARTGGLAEAVSGLAGFQKAAGIDVVAILPLYRTVRDIEPDLEPVGPPFLVPVGPRNEEARVFRSAAREAGPQVYFIEHREFFNRPGIYGENAVDYPDNFRRFAFFALASLTVLPRLVSGPVLIHAHDWHTALVPVYLRTTFGSESFAATASTVVSVHNPGYQGHYPPEVVPEIGLPWEVYNWRQLEWYGKLNFLKGGLVFTDMVTTVSPTQARELRTVGGGFGLHDVFSVLGDRLVGVLNGIDRHAWNPADDPADHRAVFTRAISRASEGARRRCSARSACLSGARRRSSG